MGKVIAELPWGWVGSYDDNEIEVVSTISDPPKVRLAVQAGKPESNLGSFSFNIRRDDGRHEEYGYLMGRLTADKAAGAFYMALRPAGQQDCRQVFYIDPNGAHFWVPVIAHAGGGISGAVTDKMVSNNGRYVTVQQGDGNFVTYDLTLGPEGSPSAAVWSAWGGKVVR